MLFQKKISLKQFNKIAFVFAGLTVLFTSCDYSYFPAPPVPKVATETPDLIASFVDADINTLNHPYWKTADFKKVSVTSLSTGNLYPDGQLNLTGTFNGISSFNSGRAADLTLRAAYNNDKVFILAEWSDTDLDISAKSWLFNGPADPLKADSATGWTSQRGADMISFAWDINGATGSGGSFANTGCAASCHNNSMKTLTGSVDIWKWNLALTDPLGYAADMSAESINGLAHDAGQKSYERNAVSATDRSGPAYEWNGAAQTVTKIDGKNNLLDPAFVLVNKVGFIGNAMTGDSIYQSKCASCHGNNGQGGDGPAFTAPGTISRFSYSSFDALATSSNHTGYSYYNSLSPGQKEDVIARIRGFSGVPGHYLQSPSGSSADIAALSNVSMVTLNTANPRTTYKVLLVRKLVTGNNDDIQFSSPAGKTYPFGIALMDNDGINHIGSLKESLIFKTIE